MATIFLSYQSDDRDLAEKLQACLKSKGHEAKFDVTELLVGDDWRKELIEALYTADGIVVLLTEKALQSPYVISEIGAARAVKMARPFFVAPVLVDGLEVPYFIQDIYCISMKNRTPEGIEETSVAIDGAIRAHFERIRGETPRIFISHRHKDKELVKALVKVLEAAFHVEKRDIRCTSVHPYRLPAGERTPDRLQAEITRAKAVLGILTPDTAESSYVLFELGSSWGQKVATLPLLAKGAQQGDIPSPISDRHPIDLAQAEDCRQLIEDLAVITKLPSQQGGGADQQIDRAIRALTKAAAAPLTSPEPAASGTRRSKN
ncbi:MAG TPA: toll/interleukin-1 receptor domain-containing protein [Thermoanaerobaculia bacterium]